MCSRIHCERYLFAVIKRVGKDEREKRGMINNHKNERMHSHYHESKKHKTIEREKCGKRAIFLARHIVNRQTNQIKPMGYRRHFTNKLMVLY